MAGRTLYFCNKGDRSCWPVRNVIGQPTAVQVTKKSGPYRNQFQTSVKLPVQLAGTGQIAQAEAIVPGLVSNVQAEISGIPLTQKVTPNIATPSDETAATPLRQDPLDVTHWQVEVVEADFWTAAKMLISIDEYPDGFSNSPPSWFEDPTPDVVP